MPTLNNDNSANTAGDTASVGAGFASPEQIRAMDSADRIAEISRLRAKVLAAGSLTDDEVRYGVRLIQAERIVRAGGVGGSKQKRAEAEKTFNLNDF